jgi:hypothetical protein
MSAWLRNQQLYNLWCGVLLEKVAPHTDDNGIHFVDPASRRVIYDVD